MSTYDRYKNGMESAEAEALGLPGYGDDRRDLIDIIEGFRVEKEKERMGDPKKGFDLAVSASEIMTNKRQPHIMHTGTKEMIRPSILHVENDAPLWNGFKVVFPRIAEAMGVSMRVTQIDSIKDIFEAKQPTPLASHAGMLLVAQSFETALAREPDFEIWSTNPAKHMVLTFEATSSSIGLGPNPSVQV